MIFCDAAIHSKDDSPTRVLIKRTAVSTQSLRINSGSISAADQELTDSPTGMLTPSAVSHDSSSELTSRHSGSAWIKRTANVRGRLSSFWRQAALAALRNQSRANQSHADRRPVNASLSILEELFRESWPTASQVELWQESFQNLLQDEDGLRVFREFLRGEFSDENIEFWVACQQYKALKVGNTSKDQAQRIYDTFIAFQSQREVNLDCETRLQTESRLAEAGPDLFDACQKRIEALMEKDPYIRFLRSALYYKLKEMTGVSTAATSPPTGVQDCGNPDKPVSTSPPSCDTSPSLSVPQNSLPSAQTASSHLTDGAPVAALNKAPVKDFNRSFPDAPYSPFLDAIVVHFPCSTSATSLRRKSREKYRSDRHSLDLSDIVSK
ncbi:Regulator of G-protein signaling 3 [Sparganum proliferum]